MLCVAVTMLCAEWSKWQCGPTAPCRKAPVDPVAATQGCRRAAGLCRSCCAGRTGVAMSRASVDICCHFISMLPSASAALASLCSRIKWHCNAVDYCIASAFALASCVHSYGTALLVLTGWRRTGVGLFATTTLQAAPWMKPPGCHFMSPLPMSFARQPNARVLDCAHTGSARAGASLVATTQ